MFFCNGFLLHFIAVSPSISHWLWFYFRFGIGFVVLARRFTNFQLPNKKLWTQPNSTYTSQIQSSTVICISTECSFRQFDGSKCLCLSVSYKWFGRIALSNCFPISALNIFWYFSLFSRFLYFVFCLSLVFSAWNWRYFLCCSGNLLFSRQLFCSLWIRSL